MAKKDKKASIREKAAERRRELETGAVEVSRKIWLAGIGAYGMAFDVARSGATSVNEQSAEMFHDLVERGGEVETEVLSRIGDNNAVSEASRRMRQMVDSSQKFQETVRDRFEARMDRMRDMLGVSSSNPTVDSLASKLEQLEDEVAAATKGTLKQGDLMLKRRLARLSEEIDAYVGDALVEEAPKKAKKPVKKAKAKAAKKPKKVEVKIDDLTLINGVGPAMAKKLNEAGISNFDSLGALKKAEAVALDETIGSRGRLIRDQWVAQAKQLAKA
ncbi:MAG: phasin family protein [Pseudomonadota bacterium]